MIHVNDCYQLRNRIPRGRNQGASTRCRQRRFRLAILAISKQLWTLKIHVNSVLPSGSNLRVLGCSAFAWDFWAIRTRRKSKGTGHGAVVLEPCGRLSSSPPCARALRRAGQEVCTGPPSGRRRKRHGVSRRSVGGSTSGVRLRLRQHMGIRRRPTRSSASSRPSLFEKHVTKDAFSV